MTYDELKAAYQAMQALCTQAADALQENIDELVESSTNPSTGLLDDDVDLLTIESDTDLVARLRAAAVPVMRAQPAAPTVPMQPIVVVGGITRFKANTIVNHLLNTHPTCDLNKLASMDFTDEDRMQFAQLIGYSVGGYADLSYVSDESYDAAEKAAQGIAAAAAQPAPVQETIVQTFTGLPLRKLRELLAGGWAVNGVSFERIEEDGTVRRGAITTGGMVLWWNQEPAAQPAVQDVKELFGYEIWNRFYRSKPELLDEMVRPNAGYPLDWIEANIREVYVHGTYALAEEGRT